MKLKINNKEYIVKYTIRALFIFEQITNKPFKIETLLDNYLFFYSMIIANNENPLTWDEFIDALDTDRQLFVDLSNIVKDYQNKESIFINEDGSNNEKKN